MERKQEHQCAQRIMLQYITISIKTELIGEAVWPLLFVAGLSPFK